MGQIIDSGKEQIVASTTSASTTKGGWVEVEAGSSFRIICIVENLSGTSPTLDWSVEHKTNPADPDEVVVELFASSAFTQVAGGPFPNKQVRYVGIGDRSLLSKKWIRPVWTLGGTNPVATVNVRVEKV